MWKSAPSGPAISEPKNVPQLCPVIRRMTSPTRYPNVIAWYPLVLPGGNSGSWRGEQPGDLLPVVVVLDADRHGQAGEPGLVAHDRPDRDLGLAARRELGPVARDRRVRVKLAPVDQQVRAQRGHRLGRGPHVGERVLAATAVVRPGSAQPAHRFTTGSPPADDGHARPDLGAFGEVVGERLPHRLETGRACSVDLGPDLAHGHLAVSAGAPEPVPGPGAPSRRGRRPLPSPGLLRPRGPGCQRPAGPDHAARPAGYPGGTAHGTWPGRSIHRSGRASGR